jgi:DNA-binding NarL/FixJ family response regulator
VKTTLRELLAEQLRSMDLADRRNAPGEFFALLRQHRVDPRTPHRAKRAELDGDDVLPHAVECAIGAVRLPRVERSAVKALLRGASCRVAAKRLGTSYQTVHNRAHRALRKLGWPDAGEVLARLRCEALRERAGWQLA